MQSKANIWRDFDFTLFGVTLLLVIIGILFIRSATLDAVDTDLINRVPSQIQFTIVGIGVVFIVASLDYRLLGSLHGFLYGFILFILGLVAGLGAVGAAGAQSWLNVGLQVQRLSWARCCSSSRWGSTWPIDMKRWTGCARWLCRWSMSPFQRR